MLRKLLRALGLIRAEEKPVAVAPAPEQVKAPQPVAMEAQILALQAKYEKPNHHYPAKTKRRHHKQRLRA
jgi:hypothetical protein